jgi:high-affinity iron transporter
VTIRRGLASVALLALAALAVALPAPARAADVGVSDALVELDVARDLVDDAVAQYAAGDRETAYTTARNAYLDHFEYVEIPLRVRDEGLTLALEEDFAALRNEIESGAPQSRIAEIGAEVQRGLDDVERALSEPGIAAPAIATVYSFTILFREGVEAVLIVAAVLAYLEASRNLAYRRPVVLGVLTAIVASVATYVLISIILQVAPGQRELLEAFTALAAVAVLFYVSFWLLSKIDHRRWMEFVRARVWAAAATGSTLALFGVGFTAVYREGVETALFYQALFGFSRGLESWVLLGVGIAAAALAVVAWTVFRAGKRIPVRLFLGTAVIVLIVLSIAFAGNTVRAFQQAAVLPVNFLESIPRLPIFLADLTGWHPTLETIVAQVLLALVYAAGALWLFVITPRRAAGRAQLEQGGAASG